MAGHNCFSAVLSGFETPCIIEVECCNKWLALAHNGSCQDPLLQHLAIHTFQFDMGEAIISLRLRFLLKSLELHLELAVES